MKKITDWLKPRSASVEELAEQLEHARSVHAVATKVVRSALEAFDDAGDDATARALASARAAEQHAQEHVARAERLLAAAEKKSADEERAALESRKRGLEGQLTRAAVLSAGAPLARREADALVQIAKIRRERAALVESLRGKVSELRDVMDQLGLQEERGIQTNPDGTSRTANAPADAHIQVLSQRAPVEDLLRDYIRTLTDGDELRAFVRELIQDDRPWASVAPGLVQQVTPEQMAWGSSGPARA